MDSLGGWQQAGALKVSHWAEVVVVLAVMTTLR